MKIGGREFPGQVLRQGMYIPLGDVTLWERVQYVTINPIDALMEPGYFNKLFQLVAPPARIEVASYVDDEWRMATLIVTENSFDPTIPGIGGTVSVRLLGDDNEPIPEAVEGLRAVHRGRGVYQVQDAAGAIVAEGLSRVEASNRVMNGA